MSFVSIDKREKEDYPFTPVVLPIFVTDFYSVFVDKSYTLFDMEIGQRVILKIMIQHEYGLMFAESIFY
jgi:hypothetical protein